MLDKKELNENIMACQGILDDLRSLSWRLDDNLNKIGQDELSILIEGLEALYDIKFRKLWDAYNQTFN